MLLDYYVYIMKRENQLIIKEGKTMEKFFTMREVGEYLRLSTQTVKRLIEKGRLTAYRIGPCSYRIPECAVQALLKQTLAGAFVNCFESKGGAHDE